MPYKDISFNSNKKAANKKASSCSKSNPEITEEILALIAFENSQAANKSKRNLQRAHSLYKPNTKSLTTNITPDFFN